MNLLDLAVKIGVDDQATEQVAGIGDKIKGALGGAAKIAGAATAAAVGAAAAGAAALGKAAIDSYGEFEQLSGGAQLMFGEAYSFIEERSQQAFKNVQMSQNEYLQQVNGFAVGLRESMGGNAQAAAELADRIVTAEADIVAATGETQENVQNAFNGIMKGNYMMLDNLKLGISPTKEGMQEVIDKVNEWHAAQGEASNYTIDSLADTQAALVDYIEMVGMAGYAGNEAAGTIQGSMSALSAAWSNFVTELGKEDGDIGARMEDLASSAGDVIDNIVPRIEQIAEGMAQALPAFVPKAIELGGAVVSSVVDGLVSAAPSLVDGMGEALGMLGGAVSERADALFAAGGEMWESFMQGFVEFAESGEDNPVLEMVDGMLESFDEALPEVLASAEEMFGQIVEASSTMAPVVSETVTGLIGSVVDSVIENAPSVLASASDMFASFANAALEQAPNAISNVASMLSDIIASVMQNAPSYLSAAVSFFGQMLSAIATNLPGIVGALVDGLMSLVDTVIANAPSFLTAAAQFVLGMLQALWENMPQILASLVDGIGQLIVSVSERVPDMLAAGGELLEGLLNAVVEAGPGLLSALGDAVMSMVNSIGGFVGDMISAGENLIGGLISGVANMAGTLASRAMDAVSGAVNGVKSFLGIASPSKLFRQFGQNTMEGFALGIGDQAQAAEDAMLNAMRDVEAAAKADVAFGGFSVGKAESWGMQRGDVYNISIDASSPQDFEAMAMEFVNAVEARKRTAGKASRMNVRVV